MWAASLNLAISIHNSSESDSPTAGVRLIAPNLPDMSLGRRSSSERHPASSNSFIIGVIAAWKASAFLLGTRYKKMEQCTIDSDLPFTTGFYLAPPRGSALETL